MKKVLCIFDAHDTPGSNKNRFHLLASLINDTEPDMIVQGGDFVTMESLSHWDRDKRLIIEGRRVRADLDSAHDSWAIIQNTISKLQEDQRRVKKKLYKPQLVWMLGNHEDWLRQWIERNPEMEGMINLREAIGIDDTIFSDVRWVRWKEVFVDGGILYCHAPIGRTGPISSKYISSRTLADVSNLPVVFGHTHRRQDDSVARYDGNGDVKVIRAVNGGCFFEEWPHYAEGNTNDYWTGVILLHIYDEGKFDVEEYSIKRLRRLYEGTNNL